MAPRLRLQTHLNHVTHLTHRIAGSPLSLLRLRLPTWAVWAVAAAAAEAYARCRSVVSATAVVAEASAVTVAAEPLLVWRASTCSAGEKNEPPALRKKENVVCVCVFCECDN